MDIVKVLTVHRNLGDDGSLRKLLRGFQPPSPSGSTIPEKPPSEGKIADEIKLSSSLVIFRKVMRSLDDINYICFICN